MAVSDFLTNLKAELSRSAKVLSDSSTEEFKLTLQRWSDLNTQTPGAIVVVATEDDIVKTVNFALKCNIPFVPKAGGHSNWSTIGSDGVVIDLSNYNKVIVDKSTSTVRVQPGVLNKQLVQSLYDEGLCVPLGGGNTIGIIPQALGGGLCALSKLCGTTSDNIISARLITASGELITVDNSTADLLWALKGAGQFFGLVTELTFQAYPLSILGTDDGTIWTGMLIFDLSQVGNVTKVVEKLIEEGQDHDAACLAVITCNPHTGDPCFILMPVYFGSEAQADEYLAPLKALGPMIAMGGMTKYTEVNNGADPFCVKGGIKRFKLAGMPRFDATVWPNVAKVFVELVKKCPDAKSGGYGFEWTSGKQKETELDSAWAHRGVKYWAESLSWYTNPNSGPEVDKAESEALAAATKGFNEEEVHTYQNFSRDTSLESRFGSKERVEKLKSLKKEWDPTGVFTTELL